MQKEYDDGTIQAVVVVVVMLISVTVAGLLAGSLYANNQCRNHAIDKGLPVLEIKELCK